MLELVSYRTARPVSASDHLAAMTAAHHACIARQRGFHRRMLGAVSGAEGAWLELVHWASAQDLAAAMQATRVDTHCRAWLSQIDLPSAVSHKLDVVERLHCSEASLADPGIGCWVVVTWKTRSGVDPAHHLAGGLQLHREVFADHPDYRGVLLLRSLDGQPWAELQAWTTAAAAQLAITAALQSPPPVVQRHLQETEPHSESIAFVEPRARL